MSGAESCRAVKRDGERCTNKRLKVRSAVFLARLLAFGFIIGSVLLGTLLPDGKASSQQGPSIVTVNGRQLIVSKRNSDGTLAPPTPYIVRGVGWSPASVNTNGNNTSCRAEFAAQTPTDAPLIAAMNANTVRTYLEPPLDASGLMVLDQLYNNGIMVILTVDEASNDMSRIQQTVSFYKNHPAVLMWLLGNEWNINLYYGNASSVADAAQRTQNAATLIKTLDTNHPVATSYGDIDINETGKRRRHAELCEQHLR